MELPKLLVLLCCIYYNYASHHSHGTHIIPIEGYDSELQDLGEYVEIPHKPVKVIKITKTVAVKIPVPYPVKVREKVPYPVHVAKPYPVPVPQIIKVPHSDESSHTHGGHDGLNSGNGDQHGPSYQIHEGDSYSGGAGGAGVGNEHGHVESFSGGYQSEGSSYDAPVHNYNGDGNHGSQHSDVSYDTSSYDQAIQEYLQKQKQNGNHNGGGAGGYHYH